MDAKINSFATRTFRDVADQDYIAARLSYRYGLYPQFYWQSLQALEKYLKAILLYNRIEAKDINHNICKAIEYTDSLSFNISRSSDTNDFIQNLAKFGRFRYLEVSYHIHGPQLFLLDKAVWEIRRYCRVINYEKKFSDGKKKNMLKLELEAIERSEENSAQKFKISGGLLEKIIEDRKHPARKALIWKNLFYGKSLRKRVKMKTGLSAVNAPLYLHPEILDEVIKYVYLPKDVKSAYRKASEEK
jgi:hypothetical protein